MIRCESSQFIKQKYLKEDEEDGVEWLVLSKQQVIVESVTSRKLVVENFSKILDCVRQMIPLTKTSARQPSLVYLNTVLMQLLPRICAFPQCDRTFQTLAFDTAFNVLQKNAVAAPALGMLMLSNPDVHFSQVDKTINFISSAIKKTTNPEVLDSYFTFLFLFVDAYHEQVTIQIKTIIPQLMDIPLSRSLANVLKMIMMRIPKLRLNVQDGVMAAVYLTLTGYQIPPKSDPTHEAPPAPKNILMKAESDPKEVQKIVLAVDVLGEFYFSRGALQRIMQYVADYYLTAGNVEIRLAAVSSCCEMVVPFMIRCESSQFIKQKYLKEDEEDGVEWLVLSKQQVIVESVTSRKLVVENFSKILDCVRQMIPLTKTSARQPSLVYLNTVLMQLLPRICAFPQCDRTFQTLAFDTAFNVLQKNAVAAPALGMLMLSNPESGFQIYQVTIQIKTVIPQLMDIPLSRSLANVLKMIMMRIPKLRLNVQDGVMAAVYLTLTGYQIPPKSDPTHEAPPAPKNILMKAESDPKEVQKIVLAVDVLGEFYFSRGALQRIMQYVADYYLTAGNVEIRLAAVSSCCEMVVPFVGVYKKVTSDKRATLLSTIYGVLRAVCSVIVNDADVRVRMQVISCFGQMPRPFLAHLAQPEMLEMQQACVTLLGRLAEFNAALVLPRLRLMLLETLSQMMQSGQARLEQHSAKMIAHLAKQSPKKAKEEKAIEKKKESEKEKVKEMVKDKEVAKDIVKEEKKEKKDEEKKEDDKKKEIPKEETESKTVSPEPKTPEIEGPAFGEKKEGSNKEKKEGSNKEKKEGSKKEPRVEKPKEEPKEGSMHGFDEMKLESDRDNLDEKPEEPKKNKSGSRKKLKSESLKLKKTQSLSPVNVDTPIEAVPPPPTADPTPKQEPKKELVFIEPQRSDLDQPLPEPEFIQNHGDTKVKSIGIKKVNFYLIGRTGMYLERNGMNVERKAAFDWIAYNRHDLKNKQTDFSKNMAMALKDIGINKHLLQRTIVYLKSHGQITLSEMDKVLRDIEGLKGNSVSFSQVSQSLKKHCELYKSTPSKEGSI
uniref:Non-specific serine/threonine protein kinase n=1 Tax=Caenorhabditis tropicalis TaxID=1561998 RepID=A0A1I7UG54_9PELO